MPKKTPVIITVEKGKPRLQFKMMRYNKKETRHFPVFHHSLWSKKGSSSIRAVDKDDIILLLEEELLPAVED